MAIVKKRSSTMSRADAAWLHMEEPTNLMMITALFTFSGELDVDRLKRALEKGLLVYDRFKMKAVSPRLSRPYWKHDPDFHLDNHIEVTRIDGGEEELLAYVGDLMSTPLDRDRPLWMFHVVHGFQDGSALCVRLHHAIADGIALLKVLLNMTVPDPRSANSGEDLLEAPQRKTAALVHEASIKVKPRKLIDMARVYGEAATDLGKLLIDAEPNTPFRGKLGVAKKAARTRPICLDQIKETRARAGCTVNDVLMAAVAGGLRRHLERLGKPAKKKTTLRAVIPVDLRRPGKDQPLGNRFGLVFLGLPVGLETPAERLQEVRRRMDSLKNSPQAVVVLGLLHAVGSIPQEMQGAIVDMFGSKATAVVTNVPGPKETLYLAGEAIESLMFWVPQSGRLGLGLSILSYGGKVRIGVATDAGLTTDAELLARDIEAAFEEMVATL